MEAVKNRLFKPQKKKKKKKDFQAKVIILTYLYYRLLPEEITGNQIP